MLKTASTMSSLDLKMNRNISKTHTMTCLINKSVSKFRIIPRNSTINPNKNKEKGQIKSKLFNPLNNLSYFNLRIIITLRHLISLPNNIRGKVITLHLDLLQILRKIIKIAE